MRRRCLGVILNVFRIFLIYTFHTRTYAFNHLHDLTAAIPMAPLVTLSLHRRIPQPQKRRAILVPHLLHQRVCWSSRDDTHEKPLRIVNGSQYIYLCDFARDSVVSCVERCLGGKIFCAIPPQKPLDHPF